MRVSLCAVVILALWCCSCYAVIATNGFQEDSRKAVVKMLRAELDSVATKKSEAEQLLAINYAATSLIKLEKGLNLKDSQIQQLCSIVKRANPKGSLKQIYDYVVANVALKCGLPINQDLEQSLKGKGQNASIQDAYHLARIIFLSRKQLSSLHKDRQFLQALFDSIFSKFDENSGSFSQDEHLKSAGMAYETLAIIQSIIISIPNIDSKTTDNLLTSLVKVGKYADRFVSRVASSDLKSAATFVRGLNKLNTVLPLKKISREDFDQIVVNYLSKQPKTWTLENAYDFVEGVASLAGSTIFTPALISQFTKKDGDENVYGLSISDIYGEKISQKVTASISRVSSSQGQIASNIALTTSDSIHFVWNAKDTLKKKTGVFRAEIVFNAEGKAKITATRSITISAALDLNDITFSVVSKETERELFAASTTYPHKLSQKLTIEKATSTKLDISFSLSIEPHQVFIRFSNNGGREAVFALVRNDNNYELSINFEKVAAEIFGQETAEYQVEIMIGDVSLKSPILWNVGVIEIQFSEPKIVHEDQELYQVRPEIHHIFNKPAPRANAQTATIFTALVMTPLAFLLLGILILRPSLGNFPSGFHFIETIIFQLLILAMLGVIAWFWVEIKIFEAFSYLAILGSAAALLGTKALRGFAEKRRQKNK